MTTLRIRLFGSLELRTDETEAAPPVPLTSACQRLLAYLLLNKDRMCRREVLMDVFWRDSSPERARSCLNSAVWRLRRELEACEPSHTSYLLTSDGGEIGFNWACDYVLDVQTFEQQLLAALRRPSTTLDAEQVQALEQGVTLYRGDLLEGIFDDWTIVERERLRNLHSKALMHLMDHFTAHHAYDKSIAIARSILADDPLREDVHRAVMRLHIANGQRALAVQQYRACAKVLEQELGLPPMEETEQVYQDIVAGQKARPAAAVMPALLTPEPTIQQDIERQILSVVHSLNQAQSQMLEAVRVLTQYLNLNAEL